MAVSVRPGGNAVNVDAGLSALHAARVRLGSVMPPPEPGLPELERWAEELQDQDHLAEGH